jgi:hypothetical protein
MKKSSVFWHITWYSQSKIEQYFGGTCSLHHQSQRLGHTRSQHEAGSSLLLKASITAKE